MNEAQSGHKAAAAGGLSLDHPGEEIRGLLADKMMDILLKEDEAERISDILWKRRGKSLLSLSLPSTAARHPKAAVWTAKPIGMSSPEGRVFGWRELLSAKMLLCKVISLIQQGRRRAPYSHSSDKPFTVGTSLESSLVDLWIYH
ncbi:uncharacterized protein MCYG_07697 [Microsporum canis CBS 113480]|uniref:Uncharacterized protein n=1 Tax=Arthroderma otae (strain ATCC MYA-4605 / CBS 113480) TaxID=554155 RepID=C5FX38_ARTOC|nr:uncharacterized protein MCYG_07697 [Microsporum canis CBS 113480]EEQ34878.1 predicted protein [Microsporum canis CBS 113480]